MIIKLFREINKLRRFMCGEGLLLTYITICKFVSSIRASDVDIFLLNPYWLLLRRLYLSMKESNLIPNNFSIIFENCGNRDTGL